MMKFLSCLWDYICNFSIEDDTFMSILRCYVYFALFFLFNLPIMMFFPLYGLVMNFVFGGFSLFCLFIIFINKNTRP